MLVRFSIQNFRSFNEQTSISMVANGRLNQLMGHTMDHTMDLCDIRDMRLLRGAFVFGANASGKSNLIRAVNFARKLILDGSTQGARLDQYYRQRNGKQGNGIERPGMFQFDFIINGSVYIYGFTFSYMDGTIGKEWLYQRQRERLNRIIFLRNEHGVITKLRMIGRPKTRFEVYARDVQFQPRNLLLSTLAQKSGDDVFQVFSEVYNWFDNLIVIFPDSMPTMSTMPALSAPALPVPPFASHEADLRREFSELLSYFDPGIAAIYSQGVGELLDLSDESAGIQRLFNLVQLLSVNTENRVAFIDELDRSMHPNLTLEFVKLFYDLSANKRLQMIVTTHESGLLDFNLLRRDEIWFAERKEEGSTLYSLDSFKVRFDKHIEKDYLLGRYGAAPLFTRSPSLPTMISHNPDDL